MEINFVTNAPQGSQEWFDCRKKGVTSTDSPAALGLSAWATPLRKWQEKVGLVEKEEAGWNLEKGTALEPLLRQHYANKFGRTVTQVPGVVFRKEHPFMLASLDGYTNDNRLVELKTYGTKIGWGEDGTDEIPADYMIQVQHAMFVVKAKVVDIHVSFFANEPVTYTVEADSELQEMIFEGAKDFWHKVTNRIEPEPTTIKEMLVKYNVYDGKAVLADSEVLNKYAELIDLRRKLKGLNDQEGVYKQILQKFLIAHGGSVLVNETGEKLVTWNEQKGSKRFDTKAFESAHPDLYAQFCKIGEPVRRFLVKGE